LIKQSTQEEILLWIAFLFMYIGEAIQTGEQINLTTIIVAVSLVARLYVKHKRPDIQTEE